MSAASFDFQFHGDCMGSFVSEGSLLTADPLAPVQPLDMVAAFFDIDNAGPFLSFVNAMQAQTGAVGMCKIHLGVFEDADGERVHILGQLNPPVVSPVPESALSGLHKVTGHKDTDTDLRMGEVEMQALKLLAPFILLGRRNQKIQEH